MTLNRTQRDLISRIFLASTSGEATDQDLKSLDELLSENDAAREYLVDLVHLHTSLSWRHEKQDILAFSSGADLSTADQLSVEHLEQNREALESVSEDEEVSRENAISPALSHSGSSDRSSNAFWEIAYPSRISPLTASFLVFGLVSIFGLLAYQSSIAPDNLHPVPATIVADLQSGECVWLGADHVMRPGDTVRSSQRLELVKGVAKFQFRSGTTVVVESPAVFEPITQMSLRLVSGSIAVRSNGPKKDFTVISPEASIVDLGTSFGVHASRSHSTEIEVFEGAVKIQPDADQAESKVLGLGGAALVHRGNPSIDLVGAPQSRFDNLLEVLWDDIRDDGERTEGGGHGGVVEAEFNDAPIPKTVDTFYGSTRGRGWVTPWLASGNPTGKVRRKNGLSGESNPYLSLNFGPSTVRTIGRAYGKRSEFDPRKPHVISWRWRYDGPADQFGGHYQDRVLFYGNRSFQRGTSPSISWLVGMIGAAEETPPAKRGKLRKFYPMRWAFYNRDGDGGDRLMDGRDMADSGMIFKPGVTYNFAVVVYPQEGRYDAAIRDDEQTVIRTNLAFRNGDASQANVIHFSLRTAKKKDKLGFSLDSVHIEPFENGGLRRRINRSQSPSNDLTSMK